MYSVKRDVEAVVFDLDGTLIEYNRSPSEVLEASFRRVGVERLFPVEAYYNRFEEFATQTDSMAELRLECFAELAQERGHDPSIGRTVAEAFDVERDQANVAFLPDVPDVLDRLRESYSLGIVTNGAKDAQQAKIEAVGLDSWMDTIVIAGQEIPPKPAAESIQYALRELDTRPEDAIFVGNSLERDVGAATAAGVPSVWVPADHDTRKYEPDYCLNTIAELVTPPWEE